jgi:hypothetical protein
MNDDTNSVGAAADNYGIEPPPPSRPARERPPFDDEPAYENTPYEKPTYEGSSRGRYRPPRYVRWIGGCLIACVLLLLVCGGATAVLAGIAYSSTPATATVDKTFTVGGAPTLIIHGATGSVHVNPGGAGQITLHATKRVRTLTHAQAQSELSAITITTAQSGNVVTIQLDSSVDGGFYLFNMRQIDLDVTTPASTSLSVVENAGSVDASGLTGKLTAQVNAGSVTLDGMTMTNGSSLRVNAGSLTLDGTLQPGASLLVEVNAGSADLTLPQNTSAHLNATASAGSVNVDGWNVAENHSGPDTTASGDLNPNPTGTITIRVNAGSASLQAA